MMCRRGQAPIQVRFSIVNDTYLQLSGNLVVEFMREDGDHVILDTVAVQLEPNSNVVPLSHDINSVLMQDVTRLTVRAEWQLDESSRQSLSALGDKIRQKQLQICGESANMWQFDAEAGLAFSQALVDPKYYMGSDNRNREEEVNVQ